MADRALDLIIKTFGVEESEAALARVKSGLTNIGHEAKEMGAEAKEGSEEAERGFRGLFARMKEGIKTTFNLKEALEFGGVAGGLFFIFDQLKDIAKEALEDAVALQKLQSGLALAGDQSKESTRDMEDFANAIVKATTVSKGEALEGMAQLASEGRLTGESLKSATTAAIGLSERLHIDVRTAFGLVSRAVLGHMEIMARYGIEVDKTKTPLENIQHIIDTGNESFQLARDRTNALSGAWTRFKNELGAIKADFGSFFDVFAGVVNFFHNSLPAIEAWSEELREKLAPSFRQIKEVAVDAFTRIKEIVGPVIHGVVNVVTENVARVGEFVAGVLVFVRDHIGLLKGALIGMASALVALKIYEHFNKIKQSVLGVVQAGKAMIAVFTSGPIGILLAIGAAAGFVIEKLGLWHPILHGLETAWEKIKQAAAPALDSLREAALSVGKILKEGLLFTMNLLVNAAIQLGHWIGNLVVKTAEWATGTNSAKAAFEAWASGVKLAVVGIVAAFAKLEYGFTHWKDVLAYVLLTDEHAIYKFANQVQYFFTQVIPAYLHWFGRNWQNIFLDMAKFQQVVFDNMSRNVVNFFHALKQVMHGGDFKFDWTPLTEGFKATTEALPKILARQEGPLEKQARLAMEMLGEQLKKGADENVKKRLDELFKPDKDNLKEHGKEAAETFKDGVKAALDEKNRPKFVPGAEPANKDQKETASDLRGTLQEATSHFFGAGRDAAQQAKDQRAQQISLQQHANEALDGIKSGINAPKPTRVSEGDSNTVEAQLLAAITTLTTQVASIANELNDFKKDRTDLNRYAQDISDHTDPSALTPASSQL